MSDAYRLVRPLGEHPIPSDQEEINELWERSEYLDESNAPSVVDAHEDYVQTIATWGDWRVFRTVYPFGFGNVVFWNGASGEAFVIEDDEGSWHELVNLFAAIVEAEGDCREAEYSDSLMPCGGYDQRCQSCGNSWMVG